MSRSTDKIVKGLQEALNDADKKKTSAYDTTATVVRSEGNLLWVHIPGGIDETPVRRTINADPGDEVHVRIANGTAWALGNETNPAAGYTTVWPSINYFNELAGQDITVNAISAATGYIDDLYSKNITTENLQATNGYIQHLVADDITAEDISASSGYIKDLTSEHITADDIIADHATIDTLDSTYATIEELHSDYAEIDLANVNNAWINHGAMKKAEVFDENVFDLSGDHATIRRIDASKINVANLRADNLVVRRINGQPVVGGYTLIDSNSSGYASKNPQALGWYEFVNAQWVLSTDTTVDMTKAYYREGDEVSLYDQEYIDGLENGLQQQIDGAVETFTGTVVPTLVNWPYTDWYDTSVTPVHDERAKHVGDIYYVVNSAADENGYCYRFAYDNAQHAYDWVLIKDSDVTKALSDISELQTFESETTSWMDETDEGLETIRTNHTALAGVVDKTVKESVQLWFTKANTTAPDKPTAEVTSTSTAGNAWRKVVPAYNASYPNYYYCWQYKFVDGTFDWSDVVRDIAMGETQGTARDAKNTADAALPASTFTSFESTTFKDVKDTVTEHSTKFTNMTSRLGLNSDGTGANTDIVAKESALETTVDSISTRVGKTETKLIGMYATSTTAAGTAAKVATITPTLPSGATWELSTGTMVTVKFMNANTAASPTLNVNSKGAKGIRVLNSSGTVTTLSADEYKWAAGSTFTFTYNGTYWLMQDSSVSVRMNSAETSITQNAEQIQSKASQSSVDSLSGRVSTAESTITQQATAIEAKVSKDGVIASINSSVEEQGGSAVKISADKVNITGTTIFNAVNSDADAKAAMLNSELEIGGRNLSLKTGTAQTLTVATSGNYWFSPAIYTTSDYGKALLANTSNTRFTVSYDYSITGVTGNTTLRMALRYTSSGSYSIGTIISGQQPSVSAGSSSGHVSITFEPHSGSRTYGTNWMVLVGNTTAEKEAIANASLTISNFKFEIGTKATDWTPAPEDVQAEIDAKKSVHTLTSTSTAGFTYAQLLAWSAEGYGEPNGSSWSATSTAGIKEGDTVRIAIPVSDMNLAKVYVVGTVVSITDSTHIKMISHGLDTTIIDGGNIITNSIGANQIASNAITADKIAANAITIGDMNQDAKDKVLNSNIEIGGRNLIRNTTSPILTPAECRPNINGDITDGRIVLSGTGSLSVAEHGMRGTSTAASRIGLYIGGSSTSAMHGLVAGETYTLSFDWTAKLFSGSPPSDSTYYFRVYMWTVHSGESSYVSDGYETLYTYSSSSTSDRGTEKSGRCEWTFTIPSNAVSIRLPALGSSTTASHYGVGDFVEMRNIKLEKGNKATSWTPAPEDTVNENLLIDSQKMDAWSLGTASQRDVTAEFGVITLNGTASNWNANCTARPTIRASILDGTPLWLSFEYKASVATTLHRVLAGCTSAEGSPTVGSRSKYSRVSSTLAAASSWTRAVFEMPSTVAELTMQDSGAPDTINSLIVQLYNRTNNSVLEIRKVKLEHGLNATDWTPSPEEQKTYITRINDEGILIHPSNTTNNSVFIDGTGMEIFKGGTTSAYSVAKYGDTARIGKVANSQSRVEIGASSIDFINRTSGGTDKTVSIKTMTSGSTTYSTIGTTNVSVRLNDTGSPTTSSIILQTNSTSAADMIHASMGFGEFYIYDLSLGRKAFAVTPSGVSCVALGTSGQVSCAEFYCTGDAYLTKNAGILYGRDASNNNRDMLHIDTSNNLVLGYGHYVANQNTYVEGNKVILRSKNGSFLNDATGTAITSDRRVKRDIKPISDDAVSMFMDLEPVQYKAEKDTTNKTHLGFIAQDVEKALQKNGIEPKTYSIVDEFTTTDTEERVTLKCLRYDEFIPLCVKMIQKQQKEIEELKEALNEVLGN